MHIHLIPWKPTLLAAALTITFLAGPTFASDVSRKATAAAVTSAVVKETLAQKSLTALGTLKANQSVNIAARISGQITGLTIGDGLTVQKGETLVQLDDREQQTKVAEARVALADAKRQLTSMQTLFTRKAISKDELDAQKAQVDRLQATLDSQLVTLSYHTLTAPFSGILGFSDISTGALISGNDVITTLDDLSVMKLYFELPENVLRDIRPGSEIVATTDAWPGEQFTGTVSAINPRINPNNLSFTALALIDNNGHKLRPSMMVRTSIRLAPEKKLSIPARSVLFDGNEQYVYVIDDENKTHKRFISTGLSSENSITVLNGLNAGERIVDQGVIKVREGASVRLTQTRFSSKIELQNRTKPSTPEKARS